MKLEKFKDILEMIKELGTLELYVLIQECFKELNDRLKKLEDLKK